MALVVPSNSLTAARRGQVQAAIVSASSNVSELRLLYSASVVFICLVSIGSPRVYAQSDAKPSGAPAGQSAAESEKASAEGPRFQWNEHPTLRLWPGAWVEFRARLQHDFRASDATIGDGRLGDSARRRIGIAGELTDRLDFQVERELTDEDPWRDVYANYRLFESLQAQAGKFKLPFSFDENTSATNLDFVYRSMAADALAPGRDRGVMAHGRLKRRTVRYEFGLFQHEGGNARSGNRHRLFGGRTLAGRLSLQPFRPRKSLLRSLAASVAVTRSELGEGLSSLRGDTALGERFYTADVFAKGRRERLGFELRWEPGPFSMKSEYMRLADERLGQSVEDTDLSPLVATGWYVSGLWKVLKGDKSWRGDLELAARVEALSFGSAALDSEASLSPRADIVLGNRNTALTFGANWSLKRWIRIQANLIREESTRPTDGSSSGGPFWSRALRFQFVL
jgi:phosphate-selective porin